MSGDAEVSSLREAALATIWFSSRQEKIARAVATHEKLLNAYMDLADKHSEYRHATAMIALLAARTTKTVPVADLTDAAVELDNAFEAESAKLTPFEDVENASAHKHPRLLSDLWTHCFAHAYFADEHAYWKQMQSELKSCDNSDCPIEAARNIETISSGIERPQCATARHDLQAYQGNVVNMETIWYEISLVMTEQCVDNNLDCKLPPRRERD